MSDNMDEPEDDRPDINDPELDAFIEEAGDAPLPAFIKIEPNYENIQWAADAYRVFTNHILAQRELQWFEVLWALSVYFATVAEKMLHDVELDEFDPNRFEVLNIVGICSATLNDIKPTLEQVEKAKFGEKVH